MPARPRRQVLEGEEEAEGLAGLALLLEFLEAETASNRNFEYIQVGLSFPAPQARILLVSVLLRTLPFKNPFGFCSAPHSTLQKGGRCGAGGEGRGALAGRGRQAPRPANRPPRLRKRVLLHPAPG